VDLALANLLSPPVLFFILGVAAAFGKSDLTVPEAVGKLLSLYLLLAIGFKGGVAAQASGLTADFALMLVVGLVISAAMPLVVHQIFLKVAGLDGATAAATAAHYGSISIVTFVTALDFAERAGVAVSGHMVAVAAAMESPAILTGLLLAALATRPGPKAAPATGAAADVSAPVPRFQLPPHLMREVFLNGSIVVLVGAFAIGLITGKAGMDRLDPFVNGIFQGALCLFLLDMGLVAARRLQRGGARLAHLAVAAGLATAVCALVGLGCGLLIGASPGDVAILTVLSASASYIAVPAAMRVALPEADPGAYLSASLGVTFPLNLTFGIPLYFAAALALG
jgi:uncharacterized protein